MTTVPIPEGNQHLDQSGVTWTAGSGLTFSTGTIPGTMRVTQEVGGFTAYWTLDSPEPVTLIRAYDGFTVIGEYPANQVLVFDPFRGAVQGTAITYIVADTDVLDTLEASVLVRDLTGPFTFGPIDALVETIRYTSLEEVKRRLGISDTLRDDLITQASIAAEVQIDQMNGRSFPDSGSNPEWPGIPEAIRSWATDAAIAVYKRADAPLGTAGSDNWIGTLDVTDEVERALRRNPLAVGYKVSFGVGFRS